MKELDYGMIGRRIRHARKLKGWSQETLAAKCGICLSFMGHIERGTRNMSLDTFANICDALDTGADELLWGIPEPRDFTVPANWEGAGVQKDDSYVMYAKIMKSVADIMGGA